MKKICFFLLFALCINTTQPFNFFKFKPAANHFNLYTTKDINPVINKIYFYEIILGTLHIAAAIAPYVAQKYFTSNNNKNNDHYVDFKQSLPKNDIIMGGSIPQDLKEIIEFYNNPEPFEKMGIKRPKGVLLTGPPGCGKTHLVRYLAQETDAELFYASGSSFVEKFVGVGAARIRNLFSQANKNKKKAIIFIDEIDAVGKKRNELNSETSNTLNALLTEMDGFVPSNVLIIAATNLPEILDEALTRSGRFDRIIEIGLPDKETRKEILKAYLNTKPHVLADSDYELFASLTENFSAADLSLASNEAALFALKAQKNIINEEHVLQALQKIVNYKILKNKKKQL